jgi:pimeloyl-ACP methyl ester carboxylesterase
MASNAPPGTVRAMPHAAVNGQQIWFEDSGGDGPVVVLAHGFLMDHEMFAAQVEALSPEFRVITWDERGHGRTETDGQPYTYWDSAADCLALMDHLGLDQAVVGGMSQGGFISLRVALTAPDRVRALVLLDTQAGLEPAEVVAGYQQLMDTWASVGPIDDVANIVAGIIIGEPAESARWIAKWKERDQTLIVEAGRCLLTRDDITDRLGEIACPALVVHGSNDVAISLERAGVLVSGLPASRPLVTIEGGTHSANLVVPQPVNAAILSFLRSL